MDYAEEVDARPPAKAGLRVEKDIRNEKDQLQRCAKHSHAKVPVILVVGKREAAEKAVNIRRLGKPGPDRDGRSSMPSPRSLPRPCRRMSIALTAIRSESIETSRCRPRRAARTRDRVRVRTRLSRNPRVQVRRSFAHPDQPWPGAR